MVVVFSESRYNSNGTSQAKEKARKNNSSDKNLRLNNSYVILACLIVDRSCLAVLQLRNYVIGHVRKRTRNYANQFAVVDNSRNLN